MKLYDGFLQALIKITLCWQKTKGKKYVIDDKKSK